MVVTGFFAQWNYAPSILMCSPTCPKEHIIEQQIDTRYSGMVYKGHLNHYVDKLVLSYL